MVLEVFQKVYDNPIIDEIVIVDDHSDSEHFRRLTDLLFIRRQTGSAGKIKLFRNEKNLGMSLNKAEAISKASNEWVIIFDSDNELYPEYLDAIAFVFNGLDEKLLSRIIFCPEMAEPDYDFSDLPKFINSDNAKRLLDFKMFRILLNTCNYLVNRDEYLRVYRYDETIQESDTIHFNYLWLCAGNSFKIVPTMNYFHRRHDGSGWLNGDHKYNMNKAAELQEKIKNL